MAFMVSALGIPIAPETTTNDNEGAGRSRNKTEVQSANFQKIPGLKHSRSVFYIRYILIKNYAYIFKKTM
jgi:hypothetical protein